MTTDGENWMTVDIVARNALSEVVESRALPPGADLRAVLVGEREARLAASWACEGIGPTGACFFCTRDGARQLVAIERRAPPRVGQRW